MVRSPTQIGSTLELQGQSEFRDSIVRRQLPCMRAEPWDHSLRLQGYSSPVCRYLQPLRLAPAWLLCLLPLMNVSDAAFKPWIEQEATSPRDKFRLSHCRYRGILNRALVQARSRRWHTEIEDANEVAFRRYSCSFKYPGPSLFGRRSLVISQCPGARIMARH